MIEGLEIPSLLLDPENEAEVIEQAYQRVRTASSGQITDFSPSSPVAALIEGQAFVYMELLWYLNQLPEALALEVLRLSGVTRSPGTKATGEVFFLLQQPLITSFSLPTGYLIPYKESGFKTTATLYIPAGVVEASVPVEAVLEGYAYNVPAFGISTSATGLSQIQSIYNKEIITGGSDVEALQQTIIRAQKALRSRQVLVTSTDYEEKAQELLGYGSVATAYPLLAANKQTEAVGNVHVFVVDSYRQKPSTATCQSIQAQLKQLVFAGSSVWVSPVDIRDIQIDITVLVGQLDETIAQAVYDALFEYLSPATFALGSSIRIKELEYVIRSVPGVLEVIDTLLESQAVNLPMANKYTMPQLKTLAVNMTDSTGLSQTFYYGA